MVMQSAGYANGQMTHLQKIYEITKREIGNRVYHDELRGDRNKKFNLPKIADKPGTIQ